jgi:hypothetical protein
MKIKTEQETMITLLTSWVRSQTRDPDDLEFYQKPPVSLPRTFTMEDKLAYDQNERRMQIMLDKWKKRYCGNEN